MLVLLANFKNCRPDSSSFICSGLKMDFRLIDLIQGVILTPNIVQYLGV